MARSYVTRKKCACAKNGRMGGGDFWTGVVTLFTLGIYAPRIVYVQCGAPEPTLVTEVMP